MLGKISAIVLAQIAMLRTGAWMTYDRSCLMSERRISLDATARNLNRPRSLLAGA